MPSFKASSLALLSALLLLPTLALHCLSHHVDWQFTVGKFVLLSVITHVLYHKDRRRAQIGGWRTPEATLHLLDLAGGWPTAFVAQRTLRHKISKPAYQVTFWLIVLVHQSAAGGIPARVADSGVAS